MTTTKKLTKAQKFEMLKAIPEVAENPLLAEFIDRELELLRNKNSADRKPTAQQVANDAIKQAILTEMALDPSRMFTVTEIQKEVPECAEMSNQRASALMRQLEQAGKVTKVYDKRKAYFSYATE